MSNLLVQSPAPSLRSFFLADGASPWAAGTGTPPAVSIADINTGVALAFTATATTVEITADGPPTISGGTIRQKSYFGTEPDNHFESMEVLRYFRAWARRKPGTTAAITAQKVIFKGLPAGTPAEIARINVAAVTANDLSNPLSDVAEFTCHNGHSNWTFAGANGLQIVLESVDPELEIVVEAFGKVS